MLGFTRQKANYRQTYLIKILVAFKITRKPHEKKQLNNQK